jgi:hypothetical protein
VKTCFREEHLLALSEQIWAHHKSPPPFEISPDREARFGFSTSSAGAGSRVHVNPPPPQYPRKFILEISGGGNFFMSPNSLGQRNTFSSSCSSCRNTIVSRKCRLRFGVEGLGFGVRVQASDFRRCCRLVSWGEGPGVRIQG